MAIIAIAVVSYETKQVDFTRDAERTIGEIVDEFLMETVVKGQKVQDLNIEFTDNERAELYRLGMARSGQPIPVDGNGSRKTKPIKRIDY